MIHTLALTWRVDCINEAIMVEAASYLGVSYRQFLNMLADFCKDGLIEKAPKGYRILDSARLEAATDEMDEA